MIHMKYQFYRFLKSFFGSNEFCCLLITFAYSLDPDQDQQKVCLICIKIIWQSDNDPERIFWKSKILSRDMRFPTMWYVRQAKP